ncbi:MAG TPA: hypothetical protein VGR80_11465 [Steroidobacteraceae bacterium]|nr:hypothetical protein [Gammaproteobacteria bacterium]HEV2286651.1 hypothetical protein [Steroidobacteraceae bacterium]
MKALLALAATVLAAGAAHADCPYPAPPDKLPDGATATLQDMLAGQKAVAEYNKAVNEYVACIDQAVDESIAKAGDKLKPEQKADMQRVETQKHNAAIDQLQSVADRFNEQVKVYKARNADAKKP